MIRRTSDAGSTQGIEATLVAVVHVGCSVASPGFVARRNTDGNYVMGHLRWTSWPGAAAARRLIVL